MSQYMRLLLNLALALATLLPGSQAFAQEQPAPAAAAADETQLGEFVVTGTVQQHFPKIAILPSRSPAYEDVIVRTVVRNDLDLSGLFRLIPDEKAPRAPYRFSDPVDVKAWQALGAESIVKVAARSAGEGKVEVIGIAYFPSFGPEPVYETRLTVDKERARRTAHRITDDLLKALTGRAGGFSSRFAYSGAWGRNRRIFTVDSDGDGLTPRTPLDVTAIAPAFGADGRVFFGQSKQYSPFRVVSLNPDDPAETPPTSKLSLPFRRSIYSVAFNADRTRMAVAVAESGGSSVYVGSPDGSNLKKVSDTEIATHPSFSPSGKLAWVGGNAEQGVRRIYVEGKAVSPAGFSAGSPTFCDTEDGVFLVYSVGVGGERRDLVLSGETGGGLRRLTQGQGSNTYPACSPDGRLLAFFSTRDKGKGLYILSLKRWTTKKVLGVVGESLRWDPLPKDQPPSTAAEESPTGAPKGPVSLRRHRRRAQLAKAKPAAKTSPGQDAADAAPTAK